MITKKRAFPRIIHGLMYFVVCFGLVSCRSPSQLQLSSSGFRASSIDLEKEDPEQYLKKAYLSTPPNSQALLKAAELYLRQGKVERALDVLGDMPNESLQVPEIVLKKRFLVARVAFYQKQWDVGMRILREISQKNHLRLQDRLELYELLAEGSFAQKKLIESLNFRVKLHEGLIEPSQLKENYKKIMDLFSFFSADDWDACSREDLSLASSQLLRGWIFLGKILFSEGASSNKSYFLKSMDAWKARFPDHPGALFVWDEYTRTFGSPFQFERIALLLPQSGEAKGAAQAIQEGFLSVASTSPQGWIRVYDTTMNHPSKLYHQAVQEGAQYVVGPLLKKEVDLLAENKAWPIPVLTLNESIFFKKHRPYQVTQFSLSREPEAEQIALLAYLKGARAATLFSIKENASEERMVQSLKVAWERLGGSFMQIQRAETDTEMSLWILKGLGLSEQTVSLYMNAYKEGKELALPHISEKPDAFFLVASVDYIRQIRPLLKFYFVGDVPVYVGSFFNPNSPQDLDLDGIISLDMPWVLDREAERFSVIRNRFARSILSTELHSDRFYALGIDAYHMMYQLPLLERGELKCYQGLTGCLSLSKEGRVIQRALSVASWKNGLPHLEKSLTKSP